jgi:predicted phosphodiesterase
MHSLSLVKIAENSRPMISRVGIVGDIHGEHERLARSLEWLHGQRLDALWCTGDIADGRGCINRSCDLLLEARVHTVAGNHDRWLLQNRVRHISDAHLQADLTENTREFLLTLPRQTRFETVMGRALLCHGVADNDLAKVWPGTARSGIRRCRELDALLEKGECRFLINGHMHFRVLIDFPQLLMMNAGTLKGDSAGISIVDFAAGSISAYELKDSGPPVRVCEHAVASGGRRIWRNTADFDCNWEAVTLYA